MKEQAKAEQIRERQIESSESLLTAIRQMDSLDSKLLIVTTEGKYRSLLSIGDIQRSIIAGVTLEQSVERALGRKVKVCSVNDDPKYIQAQMLHYRMEFMPVLSDNGLLADVVFWQEIFPEREPGSSGNLDIPVIIMAGGKGSRLQPITNIIPKPLVPIGEKPIIEIIVDRFAATGVRNFYFSVNYKREMIERYFAEIPDKLYNIEYFTETKPLGTAGSLHLLKGMLKTTFFVSNCDIIINQDYHEIYRYHRDNRNELTMVAAFKHYPIPYGTVEVGEQGLLKEMKEKPDLTIMVNAGMYILEPHLLDEIPVDQFFHITELIEKVKNRGGRVGVFPVSEGSWMDIGEWKEYNNTIKKLGFGSINLNS